MSATNHTWTASLTGNIIVECWGAGGGGCFGQSNNIGSGGGGGAYARKATIPVVNGVGYQATVADSAAGNQNGDTSYFVNLATVCAVGGKGAIFATYGAGGLAGSCVGDVTFSGGDGYQQPPFGLGGATGGGGGGSADDASNGVAGIYVFGAAALNRGGYGGDGGPLTVIGPPVWIGTPGYPGGGPGGGGGGGSYSNPAVVAGGSGGQGAVVIWEDLGVWPPCGQTPLATYGSPPPSFWPSCFNGRAYAFIM